MSEATRQVMSLPMSNSPDVLTDVLQAGAQQMLAQAIEAEVASYLAARTGLVNESGHRQVVRNGYLDGRTILTGVAPLEVTQPRVLDRRPEEAAEAATECG